MMQGVLSKAVGDAQVTAIINQALEDSVIGAL
jgi:hypothetical protein